MEEPAVAEDSAFLEAEKSDSLERQEIITTTTDRVCITL